MSVSESRVRDELAEIVDPCSAATGSNLDIVELGLVKSVDVDDGHVEVFLRLTSPMCHMVAYFMDQVNERIGGLDGVDSVELDTDHGTEWSEEMMTDEAQAKRQQVLDEHEARYREEQTAREEAAHAERAD